MKVGYAFVRTSLVARTKVTRALRTYAYTLAPARNLDLLFCHTFVEKIIMRAAYDR